MLFRSASAAALVAACSPEKPPAPVAETPKVAIGDFGIDLTAMDKAVKPGDDFFKYVNGTWLSTFKMPADKTRYGAFDILRDKSETDVHTILDELTKTPPAAGSVQEKVLNLYNSWMDEAGIEAAGITPIQADLDAINAAKTKGDIVKLMGNIDYSGPVGTYIQPDPVDPTVALQLLVKWEQIALKYDSASRGGVADARNIDGDIKVNALSMGANLWITKHVRLSANYVLNMFPDSAPTRATTPNGAVQGPANRAIAPGNTLAPGVNDDARDNGHVVHELLARAAIAL